MFHDKTWEKEDAYNSNSSMCLHGLLFFYSTSEVRIGQGRLTADRHAQSPKHARQIRWLFPRLTPDSVQDLLTMFTVVCGTQDICIISDGGSDLSTLL